MSIETDGIHSCMSNVEYHASPSLSFSGAKLLLPPSCPAKFRWAMDNPQETKPHFDFGTACHELILGKGDGIAVLDPAVHGLKKDGTIADNPTATAAWKAADAAARADGQTPVHINDHDAALRIAETVKSHHDAGPLFEDGDAEISLFTTLSCGVSVRARPDWMTRRNGKLWIVDVKTSATAEPDGFARRAAKFMYHLQAAWYVRVAQELKLDPEPGFVLIVVEKNPPYVVSVVEFDPEAMGEGRRLMARALDIYIKCSDSGEWPGYRAGISQISLPLWAFVDDEMEFSE